MNITAESYGHAVILNLKGELEEDSLGAFKQSVEHQLAGKDVVDLVLNCQDVTFIDSVALEYLLNLQGQLAERLGQVRLVKCSEDVRKIMEVTRLDTAFEIFEDIPEAIKATEV